jgi:predicted GTPase
MFKINTNFNEMRKTLVEKVQNYIKDIDVDDVKNNLSEKAQEVKDTVIKFKDDIFVDNRPEISEKYIDEQSNRIFESIKRLDKITKPYSGIKIIKRYNLYPRRMHKYL